MRWYKRVFLTDRCALILEASTLVSLNVPITRVDYRKSTFLLTEVLSGKLASPVVFLQGENVQQKEIVHQFYFSAYILWFICTSWHSLSSQILVGQKLFCFFP